MSRTADPGLFAHPTAAEAALHRFVGRPRVIAFACVTLLAVLGWAYLGLMAGNLLGSGAALGPGMAWLEGILPGGAPRAFLDILCRPAAGGLAAEGSAVQAGLVFLMWCAMVLAMMLPSAGGMIATYADIAETAAAKGERVVSPLTLTAGYVVVWLGFALVATLAQQTLAARALFDDASATGMLFSGAIFLAAGAYQFSALKHACLTACQRPFPFFFANWTTAPRGIFRLGLRQGLYCVGCCWAMMLLMFAVGVMNIVWMAGLGIVMTVEKMGATRKVSYAAGIVFLTIGAGLVAASIVGQWPRAV